MKNKTSQTTEPAIAVEPVLAAGWIAVGKQLPEFGKPVLILTDYGKMDVCRLRLEDNRVIVWVNDMRPQHTNGSVIAWIGLPACS
jgi:hypothetical protein